MKKDILEQTGSFHAVLIKSLVDEKNADAYLQVALNEFQEDGDVEAFLLASRNVVEAKGGIGFLAKKSHLNRQNLYNFFLLKGTHA